MPNRALSAGRKVMFMIDDEVVPPEQSSFESKDSMFENGYTGSENDEDGEVMIDSKKGEYFLDELEQIDDLYQQIEQEISLLATRENR